MMLAIALALAVSACGGSSASSHDNEAVTLTIAWGGYPEEPKILANIYGQALEAAGYTVRVESEAFGEEQAQAALRSGQISGYPVLVQTVLLSFFGLEREEVPSSEQQANQLMKTELEKDGLMAFPPPPYVNSYLVGTLRKTAERLGLKTDSDLKGKAEDLILSGVYECTKLIECLPGLKKYYGLEFKAFHPHYITERYEELENGKADLAMIYTTDPQLAGKSKYVTLEDDKHVFPAGDKTVFLTSQATAEEAGPDFEKTIVKVQKGLTLPVIRELNAEVELEGRDPKTVARDYLKSNGYVN
jgi:glycine betaine/choline ABC-type transport system substrate-binding protein